MGSPMRMREDALLTCPFGWMLRAQIGDLRLRVGGDHASLERSTKISIAYGRQTNLAIDVDLKEPVKPLLTRAYVWALRDSNPRPPPCKGAQGVSEGAGQLVKTPADLGERVSVKTGAFPCVAVYHGLETDLTALEVPPGSSCGLAPG